MELSIPESEVLSRSLITHGCEGSDCLVVMTTAFTIAELSLETQNHEQGKEM